MTRPEPARPERGALPASAILVDLRPPELRGPDPLVVPGHTVQAVTLAEIEAGTHGLTPGAGPVVVVCERGVRSGLAARYLRADGLDATHHPGGVPALRAALAPASDGRAPGCGVMPGPQP